MLFGDGPLPPRYVWAQIGACTFSVAHPRRKALVVYPVLKVFETGVVLVHLRVFSPERSMLAREFIDHYVNASMQEFRWVKVPPGVAAWAPAANPEHGANRWYRRAYTSFRQWSHQRALREYSDVVELGDFTFRQVSLGVARDQDVAKQAIDASASELAEVVRESMRARAQALGIRLSEDLEVLEVDPQVVLTDENEPDAADGAEIIDDSLPATDIDSPPSKSREQRIVGLAQLQAELTEAAEKSAKEYSRKIVTKLEQTAAGRTETYKDLALTLMRVAGYVAMSRESGPRHGLRLALLGKGGVNDIGSHWSGRVHSHLFRFANQTPSAAANVSQFRADLGSIIARMAIDDDELAGSQLPHSSRTFDDYSAHISASGTLWVHSRESLRRSELGKGAGHRALLVDEQQAKIELLEYGYGLHRQIADRALGSKDVAGDIGLDALMEAQRNLADFEWAVHDTGHFAEVRDQLEEGFVAYGLPRMRQRISDALRIRQEATQFSLGGAASRWSAFVAVLAGLLAVPPLADTVVGPAWRLAGLPTPDGDDAVRLAMATVSTVIVAVVLFFGYLRVGRIRSRKKG